jgi:hypothetical protein
MKRKTLFLPLTLFSTMLLLAISYKNINAQQCGKSCASNNDCGTGAICDKGICVQYCTTQVWGGYPNCEIAINNCDTAHNYWPEYRWNFTHDTCSCYCMDNNNQNGNCTTDVDCIPTWLCVNGKCTKETDSCSPCTTADKEYGGCTGSTPDKCPSGWVKTASPQCPVFWNICCVDPQTLVGKYSCNWRTSGVGDCYTINDYICQALGCTSNCAQFPDGECQNKLHDCICQSPTAVPTVVDSFCTDQCKQNYPNLPVVLCRTNLTPIPPYPGCKNTGVDCKEGPVADCYCCPYQNLPTQTERAPLNPICNGEGINTAIGCIPIGDQTSFLVFVLRWALGIAGGVAFILIIYAGFLYMSSGGDKQKVGAGKELLTAAISGLLLIIFSVFILDLFGIRILRIPGL